MIKLFLALYIASGFSAQFAKKLIEVKGKKIVVEIADTDEKRQQGLMYRKTLGTDEGMLFIFPDEHYLSFWMKNTFVPLTIGYFNKNGVLVDLKDMAAFGKKPGDPPTYQSSRPAKYALEMNQGWFQTNKIGLGSTLKVP